MAGDRPAGGQPVLIEPEPRNIVGAIVKLREIPDAYLYTIRLVDPEVIKARQIVTANTDEYRGLEANRRTTQIAFALLYLGLTLIIVLSAIWTGIAVADRLVRPIRQLIGAADEVATGNLDVTVPVRASDGDVASLGDTFNKMLQELKSQRNEILQAKDLVDERRRFSEAVLAGVTAGVIGVDAYGHHHHRQPLGRDDAGDLRPDRRSAGTSRRCCRMSAGSSRSAAIPGRAVYREQVTFFRGRRRAHLQRPGHGRGDARARPTRSPTSSPSTTSPISCRRSAPRPGPTWRAASPTRSRTR